MPLDPSISLQTVSPNPTNYISSFIDLGQKKLNLDKSRQTFDADVSQRLAESARAGTEATVAAETAAPRISAAQSNAGQAWANMSAAQLDNARAHAASMIQQLQPLSTKPDLTTKDVSDSVIDSMRAQNAPPQAIAMALQNMPPPDAPPPVVQKFVKDALVRAQGVTAHLNSIAPAPTFVNNGQQVTPVASGNPSLTGVPAGTPQGVSTQLQVPPTAPTMVNGQPGYVGPQAPQAPGAPMRPSGPALGQEAGVVGQVAPMVQHYQGIVQSATAAPQRVAILQEIKSLAPDAVTGDAPALKKLVSKLAAYTGWTGSEQTPTDVMAKESALLASQGGNTDMARLLNEAATPNGHMTKDAIQRTADQLIGIEKRNQAAQPYFAGTPPDSPLYAQKKAQWDANADPRAFEYAAKDPADQAKMKASMQKAGTWDALRRKMVQLHAMGVDPE